MNIDEKIEELREAQSEAVKELDTLQSRASELQALVQRQTGAIKILLDLKAENKKEENSKALQEISKEKYGAPKGFTEDDIPFSNKKGEPLYASDEESK